VSKKKRLMVTGASYGMCNWDEVHWADQIAEAGGFKDVVYEGIPWSDWEAGAYMTVARLLNDKKVSHLIYTGTYTFTEHYQEEQRLNAESTIAKDSELSTAIASSRTFYDKLRVLFNEFLPVKSKDPIKARTGNREWTARRPDIAQGQHAYNGLIPTDEALVVDSTTKLNASDKYGQVFVGLDDEEYYNTPLYKKYLRVMSSIALVKAVCDARGVKCIFLPFPFSNSVMNLVMTRVPDFDLMPMWDIIPATFGSIEKWKKISIERNWVAIGSHFDQWGHDEVAKAFIKQNKEFLDES
jgi:hypothetical protein